MKPEENTSILACQNAKRDAVTLFESVKYEPLACCCVVCPAKTALLPYPENVLCWFLFCVLVLNQQKLYTGNEKNFDVVFDMYRLYAFCRFANFLFASAVIYEG